MLFGFEPYRRASDGRPRTAANGASVGAREHIPAALTSRTKTRVGVEVAGNVADLAVQVGVAAAAGAGAVGQINADLVAE